MKRRRGPRSAAGETLTLRVPIAAHIAITDGVPSVSRRDALVAIDQINTELGRHGVELSLRAVEYLPEGYDQLTNRSHRLLLAGHAPPDGSLHVFWVDHIRVATKQRSDQTVNGMHWRYQGVHKGLRHRRYAAVAKGAPVSTVLHEVGHVLGLVHHYDFENVMCSCDRGYEPTLTETQGRLLRKGARRFLSAPWSSER